MTAFPQPSGKIPRNTWHAITGCANTPYLISLGVLSMATRRITPPWDFLHEASNPSLESFELSRLNHTANLRKEIAALLEQWIAEAAEALLARWVREDRQLLPQQG